MTITYSARLGLPIWSDDNDTFTRLELDAGFASAELVVATIDTGPIGTRPAPGPGQALFVSSDEGGVVYYDTGSTWQVVGRVVIGTQVIQAANVQTAPLTEWHDKSGSVLGSVAVDGSLHVDKLRFATATKNNLVTVSPQSGMTNYNPSTQAVLGYRLSVDGWCDVQGTLLTNGATSGPLSVVDGFPRPGDARVHSWSTRSGFAGSGALSADVDMLANGQLVCSNVEGAGPNAFLTLDGVRYYVGG
jgi:hypothetical protein